MRRVALVSCLVFVLLTVCFPLHAQFTGQRICLDPGHGGSDPGAVGYGITEKWANLDVGLRTRDLFAASGANVLMTRTSDVYVSLGARVNYANNNAAHRFISIHFNAFNGSAHGTETFCYSGGSSQSFDLRNKVNPKIVQYIGTHNRGVKTANFYVIRYTNMPAILTESAFIDNYNDNLKIKDAGMRHQIARAHLHGTQWHYGLPQGDPGTPWDAVYVNQSFPSTMMAGTTATAWIEFRNTGTGTWSQGGSNPVRLGTWNPQDRSSPFFVSGNWVGANRPSNMDQSSVGPNGVARFTFQLRAPSTPGTYNESWRLVREGTTWFGPSRTWTINVTPAVGTLTGTIRNANSNNPIAGATVSLNTGQSTTTNASGVYTIGNLSPATYTVTASAPGYASNSASASITAGQTTTRNINLTPTDTTPPSVPTNLSATGISASRINLSWTASTDNVGVVGYKIFRGGVHVGTSPTNSYADLGLSPATVYTYRVSAFDLAENESAQSAQASAATLPGTVAVFQEGFPNMNAWTADIVADGTVRGAVWDGSRNIGRFPGGGSARTNVGSTGTQGSWSYRDFPRPFAAGRFEGYFYDTDTHNNSRQGLHLRGYSGSTLAFSFYMGTYPASPGAFNKYTIGVYALGEGGWNWFGQVRDRKAGWNRFAIDVLPYTGSNDLKFYIGDSQNLYLVATTNRPASTNQFGISRTYVGHNYNVNHQGWYDDIGFYASAPLPPTHQTPTALSTTSIRWNYGDNSNNEAGFDLLDASSTLRGTSGMNTNNIVETGLAANSRYTRHVSAWNGTLHSVPSASRSAYTLSVPPTSSNVTCVGRTTNTWYGTPDFVFRAAGGFGAGRIEYYRYAWTQSPTHSWTGAEAQWDSGDLNVAGIEGGNWYLHVRGFNGDNIANGSVSLGPYRYDDTPPTPPTVVDEGQYTASTTQLSAYWYGATDPESGIAKYWYAIGSEPGLTDVRGWTETSGTSVTATGLSLDAGETYYFAVKAENNVGLQGAVGMSDGITVVEAVVTIPQAKALPDGILVSLQGKIVTADFGDNFYVTDPARVSGLKIEADSPAEGSLVTVAGQMTTVGGERALASATVDVTGTSSVPAPFFLSNRNMGGQSLNPYTLGVVDGIGPNNIGLLITTTGIVTHSEPGLIFINDGSNLVHTVFYHEEDPVDYLGVKVDTTRLTFTLGEGQFIRAIGISGVVMEGEADLYRVLIPRRDSDVTIYN